MKTRPAVLFLLIAFASLMFSACGSVSGTEANLTASPPASSTGPAAITIPAVTNGTALLHSDTAPLHNWPYIKYDNQGPDDIFLIYAESYPNTMTVRTGTLVTWYNMDVHWYGLSSYDGLFYASLDAEGGNFSYMFSQPGTYWYDVDPYTNMYGCVVVV